MEPLLCPTQFSLVGGKGAGVGSRISERAGRGGGREARGDMLGYISIKHHACKLKVIV